MRKILYFLFVLYYVFIVLSKPASATIQENMEGPSSAPTSANAEVIPQAPTDLRAEVSENSISLHWTDQSLNEAGFKIERKSNDGAFELIAVVEADRESYQDSCPPSGSVCYYRVRAFNEVGKSDYTNEMMITTSGDSAEEFPAAPVHLSLKRLNNDSVKLYWTDKSGNEAGFIIERSENGGTFTQIAAAEMNAVYYKDLNLTLSKQYFYRVKAYNAKGLSPYSNVVEIVLDPLEIPEAPVSLSATASSNVVHITWTDKSSSESGFKIERKTAGGAYEMIAVAGANTTSYSDKSRIASRTYYYRIRAYNASGKSNYSNEVKVPGELIEIKSEKEQKEPEPAPLILAAPANLEAKFVSETSVTLHWADMSDNEDGFRIERKTAAGDFQKIAIVEANKTTYEDRNLLSSTTYIYRVQAYNTKIKSEYSDETEVTTKEALIEEAEPKQEVLPADIDIVIRALNEDSIELSWEGMFDEGTGISIERKIKGEEFKEIALMKATAVKFTDGELQPGLAYTYRIKAQTLLSESDYSEEITIQIKEKKTVVYRIITLVINVYSWFVGLFN